jgi:hypothetical protein
MSKNTCVMPLGSEQSGEYVAFNVLSEGVGEEIEGSILL